MSIEEIKALNRIASYLNQIHGCLESLVELVIDSKDPQEETDENTGE